MKQIWCVIFMKKTVNSPDGIKERIPKAFKSKLPLVAGLSAAALDITKMTYIMCDALDRVGTENRTLDRGIRRIPRDLPEGQTETGNALKEAA